MVIMFGTYWLQSRQFVYIKVYNDNKFSSKIHIYVCVCVNVILCIYVLWISLYSYINM